MVIVACGGSSRSALLVALVAFVSAKQQPDTLLHTGDGGCCFGDVGKLAFAVLVPAALLCVRWGLPLALGALILGRCRARTAREKFFIVCPQDFVGANDAAVLILWPCFAELVHCVSGASSIILELFWSSFQ